MRQTTDAKDQAVRDVLRAYPDGLTLTEVGRVLCWNGARIGMSGARRALERIGAVRDGRKRFTLPKD